ncbi:uncharacterized protein LOC121643487 isoform X2 [Melanotaenia boesemani]|uniref:uncharacterized protein LOC121643487 isoform X2 n=1 Tax=Melanotaenia boesemani TaxID=1250792 RepID=UPI001C03F157|nr:uncharacterized protein LOC121643487 isoform X2 [Melanotaenia boesemani]
MEAVLGLLLLLLGVSHVAGEETDCDGRYDGAQCYGLLGGTVVLRLMDNASVIPGYDWIKENIVILRQRNNMVLSNAIESRSLFVSYNGTFRINNLNMTDSGEYTLITFDSNGQKTGMRTLQLSFKEPKDPLIVLSAVLSVLLIFLIIGAVFIFIKKKNQSHKEEDSDQELTYAEVSVVQPQGRQVKQKMEVEVEYGQVKFSEQPK